MFYLFCYKIILPFSKLHAVGEGLAFVPRNDWRPFYLTQFSELTASKVNWGLLLSFLETTEDSTAPTQTPSNLKGSSILRVILCPSAIFVPFYFASGAADRRDLDVSNESSRWNYRSHRGGQAWTPSPGNSLIETVDKREMITCKVEPWARWYREMLEALCDKWGILRNRRLTVWGHQFSQSWVGLKNSTYSVHCWGNDPSARCYFAPGLAGRPPVVLVAVCLLCLLCLLRATVQRVGKLLHLLLSNVVSEKMLPQNALT